MRIFLALFAFFLIAGKSFAQQVPFTVEIDTVLAGPLPAMHSFSFAQSGDKWLFVGGRINGLHGFSTNNSFDVIYASDVITVIDTSNWTYYTSPLGQLPTGTADPLRATNAQYTRIGDYLYIAGGFGWDSLANGYRTFPKLTAIHVDNMINAVMVGSSIAPHIRQITDTNLRICGGEMQSLNGETFLFFGHNFYGRYSDPPQPTFTQIYSNEIKRFTINDDGVNLSVTNYSAITDTNNFHRRDLNVGPVVQPDGDLSFCAYSGVFRKDFNLPYLSPVNFDPAGNTVQVDSSFSQQMNNYTCAYAPLFDSVQGTMYTVFFGGISMYDYNPQNNQLTLDSLVPFVADISVLVHDASGNWSQVPLQLQMPGLQGSNMKFVPVTSVPQYANEVMKLREMSGRVLAGYLVGGIIAEVPNFSPQTWANDTVYRVWITPDQNLLSVSHPEAEGTVDLFPNPSRDQFTVRVHTDEPVEVQVFDVQGRIVISEKKKTRDDFRMDLSSYASGIYTVQIVYGNAVVMKKLSLVR